MRFYINHPLLKTVNITKSGYSNILQNIVHLQKTSKP